MPALKHVYDVDLLRALAGRIQAVWAPFPQQRFVRVVQSGLARRELKARVEYIATCLHDFLPADYPSSVSILLAALPPAVPDRPGAMKLENTDVWLVWPLCRYVALYGLEDLQTSVYAFHALTQRFSCEFAVRPFLNRYPTEMFAVLTTWVKDDSPHVRRLVSEGTRPYLPWAARLEPTASDPRRTVPLLTTLRNDSSNYVRTSVANHLNDLSRLSPALVLEIVRGWEEAGWTRAERMKPKALRTLLRNNHPQALASLGLHPPEIILQNLRLQPTTISIGEAVHFSGALSNRATHPQYLRIDYVIHYRRASGKSTRKVFRLRTVTLGTTSLLLSKTHTFADTTTRKHYPGEHRISLQINGVEFPIGVVKLRSPAIPVVQDDYATDHTRYSRLN